VFLARQLSDCQHGFPGLSCALRLPHRRHVGRQVVVSFADGTAPVRATPGRTEVGTGFSPCEHHHACSCEIDEPLTVNCA
jgi:hypothetical protein